MALVKYTKELLQEAVDKSVSYAGVLRYLGLRQAGGTQTHITKRIKKYEIDISHFTHQGWCKGKVSISRKTAKDVLILRDPSGYRTKTKFLKRSLLEVGVKYVCSECGVDQWNGKKINLHVDHINGKWYDNRQENLRFLCPNCHSQTVTYCGRNIMQV